MIDRVQKFRDARFGMFMHWGPYSLAGVEASWPLVQGTISWHDVLGRPGHDQVRVRGLGDRVVDRATLLSSGQSLEFDQHRGFLEGGALRITLPDSVRDPDDTAAKLELDA